MEHKALSIEQKRGASFLALESKFRSVKSFKSSPSIEHRAWSMEQKTVKAETGSWMLDPKTVHKFLSQ